MHPAGTEKLRIVVCGYIGLFPAAGAVWDYIQYPLGLARLGHEVYYIEDTGNWPQYVPDGTPADGSTNIEHLRRVMNDFGLRDRWAYLNPVSGEWAGMPGSKVSRLLRSADVFISISCSAAVREDWLSVPVRVVIDSDPMFTQIQASGGAGFTEGSGNLSQILGAYSHHFTFGERIGKPDCLMPSAGFEWHPTRQPVVLDCWNPSEAPEQAPFTTVMNWSAGPPLLYDNAEWGQKDREFHHLRSLPSHFPERDFNIVVTGGPGFRQEEIEAAGWKVLAPETTVPDWRAYRDFIQHSAAEVSIAKHAYVRARTGWFSCRTACYLAMGRPALVQDTGWTGIIPAGRGILSFSDGSEAREKMQELISDQRAHGRAAREIAAEWFESGSVLGEVLRRCGAAA